MQLNRSINRILLKIFSRDPAPGSLASHHWNSDFRESEKKRHFESAEAPGYRAGYRDGHYRIDLNRPKLFAWAEYPDYRYRDFCFEMELEVPGFSPGGSSVDCAAGFLFRMVSEDSFYSLMFGNNGMYRLDFVFNGYPRTLIPWTDAGMETGRFRVKLLAVGTLFTLFLDDRWIGEIQDDGSESGGIALAAQNFGDEVPLSASFFSCSLESRSMELEVEYLRWTKAIKPDSRRRLAFADRLAETGRDAPALVQYRKAFTGRKPDADEQLRIAACAMRLAFYDTALSSYEAVLEEHPEDHAAVRGKAQVLYVRNRFEELRDFLASAPQLDSDPLLLQLMGNAHHSLGKMEEAAHCYASAYSLDSAAVLNALYAARSYERLGDGEKSLNWYREAVRSFYRNEDWLELEQAMEALRKLDPEDVVIKTVEGKIAFAQEDFSAAEAALRPLLDRDTGDSTISYLCALIDLSQGKMEDALAGFRRAEAMEPEYSLYRFKRCETEYLLGRGDLEDCRRLCELDPEQGWYCNLLGMLCLEQERYEEAEEVLYQAVELLSEEMQEGSVQSLINLSEAVFQRQGAVAALELLDSYRIEDSAELDNRRGNLLLAIGDFSTAADAFLRAVKADPDQAIWQEHAAAALLSADRVPEAEELLSRLLEEGVSADRYLLASRVAGRKGELSRSEAALQAAVELGDGPLYSLEYAEFLFRQGRYNDCDRALCRAEEYPSEERMMELRDRLTREGGSTFSCTECGRRWWVAKDHPEPDTLRLRGEPPAEAPAGQCPECHSVYCVSCGMKHLSEGRFHCPDCKLPLKLNDPGLRSVMLRMIQA